MLVHRCLRRFIFLYLFFIIFYLLNFTSATRTERDGINGQEVGVNIEWLTDAQLSELSATEGRSARLLKLKQFYDALETSPAKEEAKEKIVKQCYDWLDEIISEEEKNELETLHEKNRTKCHDKMHEYLNRVAEEKREQIEAKLPFCEHVWYGHTHKHENPEKHSGKENEESNKENVAEENVGEKESTVGEKAEEKKETAHEHHHVSKRWAHRHRRDHFSQDDGVHEHQELEDYLSTHLSWLTDDQKAEIRSLKAEGAGKESLRSKVMQYFEQSTGEQRIEAIKQLTSGCRELLRRIFGNEAAEELKQLKESGTSFAELEVKIEKLTESLDNEEKKQEAKEYGPSCKRIFALSMSSSQEATTRRRRDKTIDETRLEQTLKTHLSWLSDEQKAELKTDVSEGKIREEIKDKIMKWFEEIGEETEKEKARELLKGGCREVIKELLGEEAAIKLKQMRESGATPETLSNEVDKLMNELKDEKKKEKSAVYTTACKQIFGIKKSRKRRDHHHGHQEGEGHHHGHQEGEGHHHGHQEGEGHHHGHQEGEGHHHGHQEGEGHHHGHQEGEGHHLEDYFKTHLSWLDEKQRENLKTMKGEGKSREEMQKKVMEWFDQLQGEEKNKALQLLQTGCFQLLKITLGEDKAIEVKQMRESGTDVNKIDEKIHEWMGELSEHSHLKKLALEYRPICRKLFGVKEEGGGDKPVGRRRRSWSDIYRSRPKNRRNEEEDEEEEVQVDDDYNNPRVSNIEENERSNNEYGNNIDDHDLGNEHLNAHRTWLTPSQKRHLKRMREKGHESHEIHDKIHEYHETSPEEVKTTAQGILKKGCESILQRLFGEYIAEEIIEAREHGASKAELDEKINTALGHIHNPKKRKEASRFAATCRKIFAMIERRRRSAASNSLTEGQTLEELFDSYLSWLTLAQQEELKRIQNEGYGRSEMQKKVLEWLSKLTGSERNEAYKQMREGCTILLHKTYGEHKANELRNKGLSEHEIVLQLDKTLNDEQKIVKYNVIGPFCREFFKEENELFQSRYSGLPRIIEI